MACACPREPGAHGASDGGAAQEHPRLRARDRAPAHAARSHRALARRGRRMGNGRRAAGALAMADRDAAPVEAHRLRRGGQRPFVLPLHVPERDTAAVRHACPRPRAHVRRRRRGAAGGANGLVDRRRPRRQPVRHRADARVRDSRAGVRRLRPLPRRGSQAGGGTFDVRTPGRADACAAGTRRLRARRQSAPQGRAVSPRDLRRVFATRGDVEVAHRTRAGAPAARRASAVRHTGGARGGSRDHPRVAAHALRRAPRDAAIDATHRRRAHVRLPSRVDRPAAKRRRARGGGGGAPRSRGCGDGLPSALRKRARRAARRGSALAAAPRLAAHRLHRAHAFGARHRRRGGRRPSRVTARAPCRTTSSASARRCRTSSRSRCSSRRRACCAARASR